jgi:hypothetical protein
MRVGGDRRRSPAATRARSTPAPEESLDFGTRPRGRDAARCDIGLGFPNPLLHLRVVEPELIVRDEACRDQLKRSSIGSFENQKVPGFEPKLCADFLGKGRPALLVETDDG